jgi:ribosomal protein S2
MSVEALPGVLFIVDTKHEYIAVAEAKRLGVPVVAMVDTNSDPTVVDYPIPANDDSAKSIRLILGILIEGVQDGLIKRAAKRSDTKKLITKEELVQIEPEVTIAADIDTNVVEAEINAQPAEKPKRKRTVKKPGAKEGTEVAE